MLLGLVFLSQCGTNEGFVKYFLRLRRNGKEKQVIFLKLSLAAQYPSHTFFRLGTNVARSPLHVISGPQWAFLTTSSPLRLPSYAVPPLLLNRPLSSPFLYFVVFQPITEGYIFKSFSGNLRHATLHRRPGWQACTQPGAARGIASTVNL